MTPPENPPSVAAPGPFRPSPRLVLGALGIAVCLLFVGFLLASTEGHFVPPVVDLYVICQYAKAMAEGHPFQYNAGDPPSTGATSVLHTVLLAIGHAAGARGEGLVAFAMALGCACFLATILLAYRAGRALRGETAGCLAAAMVALNGPVAWGFLYGSDIALFMLLATWLLERMVAAEESGEGTGVAIAGVLIALARPEGLPIAAFLAIYGFRSARHRRDRAVAFTPLLAALLVPILYKGLTGSWLGTSVADKSLFASYGFISALALSAQYGVDVLRGLLLGFYSSEASVGFSRGWAPFFFPPLGLLLILLFLAWGAAPARRPALRWLGLVGAIFVLVTPNIFMGVHFNRYLMWAFPGLLVLMACGLVGLATWVGAGDRLAEQRFLRWAAAFVLGLGALSAVRFAGLFADAGAEVWGRDVAAARWISAHLPPGVAIANVATSVEYLTGHRNLNLHGVTSPAFFGNRTAERDANTFEALGRLAASERPLLLISSVGLQSSSPLLRHVTQETPLFQTTSLSDELLVLRMDYSLLERSRILHARDAIAAVQGLTEVDRLNVCDTADERAHEYEDSSYLGNLRLNGALKVDSYPSAGGTGPELVADAGRLISGQQSFRVRSRSGADLVMVMRTAAASQATVLRPSGSGLFDVEVSTAAFQVWSDGQAAGSVEMRPGAGWSEQVVRVPGRLVGDGSTRIRIQGRYAAYHFWFFQ